MGTKRNKIRPKVRGRSEAVHDLDNVRKEIKAQTLSEANKVTRKLINAKIADRCKENLNSDLMRKYMCSHIGKYMTSHVGRLSTRTLGSCVDLLKKDVVDPYQKKCFGRCTIIKRTIEIWLHDRHAKNEISLDYIDAYLKAPVNVNQKFSLDDASLPWCPSHHDSYVLWADLFRIIGVLISSENTDNEKVSMLKSISSKKIEDYLSVIKAIEEGSLAFHMSYCILPGEEMHQEV